MKKKFDQVQKQRMIAGLDFYSSDPQLIEDKKQAFASYTKFNSTFKRLYNAEKKLKILGKTGKNIKIVPPIHFSYGYQIFLGNNVHVNTGVFLGDAGKIILGDNVLIGPYTQIYTTNHQIHIKERGTIQAKDVIIDDNVWIGGNVIILPGVHIGYGAVIGAGSIVTKDIPPMTISVGSPTRVIKHITEEGV